MKISEILSEAPRRTSTTGSSDSRITFKNRRLRFLGSPCTKDCSGHKAGYEWSAKNGNSLAASSSKSFNNGARLRASGK